MLGKEDQGIKQIFRQDHRDDGDLLKTLTIRFSDTRITIGSYFFARRDRQLMIRRFVRPKYFGHR
ncbi:MAG: hypothetical protein Q4A75_09660 [Peptostreptococcaceae bacterium]|nr:hypothetical protein [Peptostreptococcaceae bacterium]